MKKILLVIFIVIFSMQICLAEGETVEDIDSYFVDEQPAQTQEFNGYLEYNQHAEQKEQDSIDLNPAEVTGINITKPKNFASKSLISNSKKVNFQPMEDKLDSASKFSTYEYNISPISSTFTQKFGKFNLGTSYGSYLDGAQVNYTTSIFSKYEGKHFAITSGITKYTNNNDDSYYNDRFYLAPEWKITKRLSLLDVMQTDVNQLNKKNELVLRYTPHFKKFADEVQLELGAGQSFYNDSYVKSSLRFSTNFKL